jgi:nitroreductase
MEKKAKTNFPIHPILGNRWSPRTFNGQKIEKEKIQRIFEAARWSPSASNEQPWIFIIGEQGDQTYQKIYDTLVEFNQLWTSTAPFLMIAIGKKTSLKTGKANDWFKYDVGQSLAHLSFQAGYEGLFVHQMGGFDAEKARKSFLIPEDYEALTAIAIGYLGDFNVLHPKLQKLELAERVRKNTDEFVFSGKFGEKSSLI